MSWEDIMRRVLPPIGSVSPHVTGPGAYGAGVEQGRQPPSTIPHGGVDFNYIEGKDARLNKSHPALRSPVDGIVPAPIRGRVFFSAAVVLRVAFCFIAAMAVASSGDALAQTQPQAASPQSSARKLPPVKQTALTEKQIQGVIAASKDIHAITDSAPEDIDKLSAKTVALLDVVARKNGLASYDEYKSISENVGLVFGGYDTVTRKYVGKEALIKLRIARVRADKKMPAEDKKEALQDLNDDLQFPLPLVENRGNIALVVKYLDRLSATMRGD